MGRLQSATDNLRTNTTLYTYDGVGNLDYFIYPNGVKHDYTYTAQNRLNTLAVTKESGFLLRRYEYALGATGSRIGVIERAQAGETISQRRKMAYEYDRSYTTPSTPTLKVYRH